MGLKTYTFDSSANALAQWCTSWYHQFRASVQNPGANPRGIMRLSDDVVLGVQTPRKEPLQKAAAHSFLVVLAREIMIHLTMTWPLYFLYCGGYSYLQVKNEGLTKSPWPTSSIRIVGRWSGGHQRLQNGRLPGAFESASRFKGTSKS